MDMLRVELDPNGTFTVGEYGTVNDLELFHALRAYSPYHNVKDGTAYPAVLLTAGESDPFAKAYHAKKMAARLQAATSSCQPVLLRVRSGGHGPGSLDQRVSEVADIYAFLFDRLNIAYHPPADRQLEDG
jgi:prolyl oligopeptidase